MLVFIQYTILLARIFDYMTKQTNGWILYSILYCTFVQVDVMKYLILSYHIILNLPYKDETRTMFMIICPNPQLRDNVTISHKQIQWHSN